jgi:hypothetical protein
LGSGWKAHKLKNVDEEGISEFVAAVESRVGPGPV